MFGFKKTLAKIVQEEMRREFEEKHGQLHVQVQQAARLHLSGQLNPLIRRTLMESIRQVDELGFRVHTRMPALLPLAQALLG